ncbi:HNH endonuclease [Beggiatoa leptomitoformis]|uniref:HNH endonuclease n=1 Tax=Beggiatoa leptomitoformis TaxID=288004 RepID=A0A2N9YC63_9GAMM|nr:HNH endonuclease [Beggiatoa leptomitoformis]ALG66632.1 HNH endonuclease [Beggiatoa leptomitoformis]AUI68051.1 HNH endonuclease [Beggiatoa leptomitoformis]
MSTLKPKQLFEQVLRAVDESGWQALILDSRKPFCLRLFRGDEKGFDVRVYLWNCTHGGGAARAKDEYRVQLTGVVPSAVAGEVTLLLGWHSDYEVFVGFDIKKHDGQASQSPSIQVKEKTLQNAHTRAFAIYHRQNGEIAVAFRPEFLAEYALNSASLHLTGKAAADMSLLNNLDTLTESQIVAVQSQERQIVLSQIARKFRATDFRKRVLGAYEHRCAICGVQLELIDAAHIIPVAAPTSTDETKNGIALCKLHHTAFDRNLISFNERYEIEVSDSEVSRLTATNLVGGLKEFKQHLRTAIILPNDQCDYPPPQYIAEARKVRSWA